MIDAKTKTEWQDKRLREAMDRTTFRSIRSAAFEISRTAKASIVKSEEPSAAGSPPTTRGRGRQNLRGAIFVDANKDSGIIGPRASYVGESGAAHEFGDDFKGDKFDERSFMRPALEHNLDRFAQGWSGQVGG